MAGSICIETAMAWLSVHIGFDSDDLRIGGLEVWEHKWRRMNLPSVELPHPTCPDQMHRYNIYEIGDADSPVRFATTELSNGVWVFYVPQSP
jgi:hypothetical protein